MLRTMQRLGSTGEVIYYYPEEGVMDLAYIVNVLPKSDHVDIYCKIFVGYYSCL